MAAECLMKLKDIHGKLLECPQCLYLTKTPEAGVDYLPTDDEIVRKQIALNNIRKCKHCQKLSFPARKASLYCKTCNDYFCGACSDAVHMKIESMNHFVSLATSSTTAESMRKERLIKSAPSKVLEEREKIKKSVASEEKRRCYSCQSNIRKSIPPHVEQEEREEFTKLLEKMNSCIDEYGEARKNLLNSIEKLKGQRENALQMVWQHFQTLRKVIDETETNITEEITNICTSRLNTMDAQNVTMLDRIADAKLLSQKCVVASKEDIQELFLQKERLRDSIDNTTDLLTNKMKFVKDDIFVQFPERETLLCQIRISAFIVQVCNPPSNFQGEVQQNGDVHLTWAPPQNSRFIYPSCLYAVYTNTGDSESFVQVERVKKTSYVIPRFHSLIKGKTHAQFKVASINVIGESELSYPIGLKLIKS